jgi:hypothetical protein
MKPLTTDDLTFLARFSKSPEGQRFVGLLRARLVEHDAKLRTGEGAEVHRTQGRALELDDLIVAIMDAEAKLNRNMRSVTSRNPYVASQ